MNTSSKWTVRTLVGVGVVTGAIAATYWVKSGERTSQPSPGTAALPETASVARVERQRPPDEKPRNVVAQASAPTFSDRFKQLTASRDPVDAMQAYNLAVGCIWAQEAKKAAELQAPGERTPETSAALKDGSLGARTAATCGDLTQAQLTSRTQYLTLAAESGVPMAAIRLSAEGPWGDPSALVSRADDPAVLEWRRLMADLIRLAASKGDTSALLSLSNMYANGSGLIGERDPAKALEYATAMWDVRANQTGQPSPMASQQTERLAKALTPEQAKQAIEAGHQLAVASVSEGTK